MFKRGQGKRMQVDQIDINGCLVQRYNSMQEAADQLKISQQMISKCARGLCHTYKGFKWVKVVDAILPNEIWKTHPTLDIQCSTLGRIKIRGVIAAGHEKEGYLRVGVNYKVYYAHRLICETFLKPNNGETQVHHKNHDRQDNRLINLEWCTPQHNSRNRKRNLPGFT